MNSREFYKKTVKLYSLLNGDDTILGKYTADYVRELGVFNQLKNEQIWLENNIGTVRIGNIRHIMSTMTESDGVNFTKRDLIFLNEVYQKIQNNA